MLYDAHNHLQDDRLDPWRNQIMEELARSELAEMVVNGSSEEDWESVAKLAQQHSWIRPAFGLHPWYVKERSPEWKNRLLEWVDRFPQCVIGEIGLDRWIEDPDVPAQVECFRTQMEMVVSREKPVTIHCLRAWGLLNEELSRLPALPSGFLLHSYGGPTEMIPGFVKMGAYFSLSPYFGHPRKAAQLEVFKSVPLDRLLAETDAPDMWPPHELNPHPLGSGESPLNHPANLTVSYEFLAKIRGIPMGELVGQIASNYRCLFGGSIRA